ncbi:MAG TPA: Gfo/Idh/MocA family oxidoreductase, partial [Terriglobales bacterium]|nr:Gfo/Idh/MocA family oxidoreductase [Terriglobales bacterium]
GFQVHSIYDLDAPRAQQLAKDFAIPLVARSLEEAVDTAPSAAIFDVALPASEFLGVLPHIPAGSAVLLQKPMGQNLDEASRIRDLCHKRDLTAAVNFQMRRAPSITRARELIAEGRIGTLHDIEVRVNVYTPWHLWTFLEKISRVEILYHSIHYIDLIRSFCGDPARVYARTLKHPNSPKLAATRSNIILDYGDSLRANITASHGHNFGLQHQESYVKWEGTEGAIKAQLGLLMNYPKGERDYLAIAKLGQEGDWEQIPVEGSWFPDAFANTMQGLMDCVAGKSAKLETAVDDAYRTMAVLEAAYESDATGGTAVRY